MAKLVFDAAGERFYHTGVSKCALFVKSGSSYGNGVAWNGITNATATPEGGDVEAIYADDIKYLSIPGNVEINASVTAYTYPEEFNACMGLGAGAVDGLYFAQQDRVKFGLVWKSKIGNDVRSDYGYVLNILYNCLASPAEISNDTINESPEAAEFSFEITTDPVSEDDMPSSSNLKPTSWVRIECKRGGLLDSDGEPTTKLQTLLDLIYGTDSAESTLPTPATIASTLA